MTKIQNFTYHSHNNFGGVFDGRHSPEDMISAAEKLGFETIGVSNHLIWHHNMPCSHTMFFKDFDQALDTYKRSLDCLDEIASRHSIKILKGFEVDFFPSKEWRNGFEKMLKELKVDYLIGSTHFIRTEDESQMWNIYHLDELPQGTTVEDIDYYLSNYWKNILTAISSGYFNFMAHLDYCTQFNLSISAEWDEYKWQVIESLDKNKMPFEVNTSGISRIGRPFPDWWMVKELCRRQVPVLISDDAHYTEHLGRGFAEVEEKLKEFNCVKRFKL